MWLNTEVMIIYNSHQQGLIYLLKNAKKWGSKNDLAIKFKSMISFKTNTQHIDASACVHSH